MSRYAQTFFKPHGLGDARPTALQIVQDEGLVGKLTDKVFLVMGVSSGIGIETMRALYATGGHVFGTVRNMEKGKKVIDEIKANTKRGKLTLIEMELDSMVSIKKGAEAFLAQSKTLNILINNAGVMATPEGQTKDGFETQFGTDHLGHFYLFQLLKPTLLASSTPVFPSRVVSASSIGHRQSRIRPDDYHFHQVGSYNPWLAYGQAKTANILFANEVERRYGARGLHTTSLHPGGIMTGLQAHVDPAQKAAWDSPVVRNYMKDAAQGAATSVYAALSAEWAGKGGRYWINCVEQTAFAEDDGEDFYLGDDGYQTWAYDEEMERRLWKYSLRLVGLSDDQ